jgi:hypothetical protein
VFLVGTGFVIWALVLLSLSKESWQQLASAIAAASIFFVMYRQQFWKGPVEHIRDISAQQARFQAAFIGYMNRVAQLRLVFEDTFTNQRVSLHELERFQRLLNEATGQVWHQVKERTEEDDWTFP